MSYNPRFSRGDFLAHFNIYIDWILNSEDNFLPSNNSEYIVDNIAFYYLQAGLAAASEMPIEKNEMIGFINEINEWVRNVLYRKLDREEFNNKILDLYDKLWQS